MITNVLPSFHGSPCIFNISSPTSPSLFYSPPLLRSTTSELWCLFEGKRKDFQNCYVLYGVLKLCTVISTLRWAVLTVLWIGLCHTGSISLCVGIFVLSVCILYVLYCIVVVLLWARWDWWDWSSGPYLSSVLWHCWLGHLTRKYQSRPQYDL